MSVSRNLSKRRRYWYVVSDEKCDVNGCRGRCVAMDIMVADGRRCIEHIPWVWLSEMEDNANYLFDGGPYDKKEYNRNVNARGFVVDKASITQEEIDALLTTGDIHGTQS